MQKSFAVAALIGATNNIKVNYQEDSFVQLPEHAIAFAQAAAKSGSGVRAKWIELPNCQTFVECDTGGPVEYSAVHGEVIPLAADLSNAIIATCKGPTVAEPCPVDPVPIPPPAVPTPTPESVIYDPVWKTSVIIPDQEHQVAGLQNGTINKTYETTGPTGDFHPKWKYDEYPDGSVKQPF
jgi:hypothetical protein